MSCPQRVDCSLTGSRTHDARGDGSGERERITKVTRLAKCQFTSAAWTALHKAKGLEATQGDIIAERLSGRALAACAPEAACTDWQRWTPTTSPLIPPPTPPPTLLHRLGTLRSLITIALILARCHDHIRLRAVCHFKLDSPRVFFTTQEQQPIPLAV